MAHAHTAFSSPRALLTQWVGVLAGPVVWLVQFQTNYTLVQWTCAAGTRLPHHLVSLTALLLVAGGGLLAWRTWKAAGSEWPSSRKGGPEGRSRLMGLLGLMTSTLFFLVVLAQWIPAFIVDPCLE